MPTVASTPVLTRVASSYELAPVSVSVAAPIFVRPPLLMMPPIVTAESIVSVRVAAPRSTLPEKVRAPVSVVLPSSMLAPRTRLFASERATALLAETRPALSVTVPVPKAVLEPARSVPWLRVVPRE